MTDPIQSSSSHVYRMLTYLIYVLTVCVGIPGDASIYSGSRTVTRLQT